MGPCVVERNSSFANNLDCHIRGKNLHMPQFSKEGRFTPTKQNKTSGIARARIHLERAIGPIKNVRISKTEIPLTMHRNKIQKHMHGKTAWETPKIQVQNPSMGKLNSSPIYFFQLHMHGNKQHFHGFFE